MAASAEIDPHLGHALEFLNPVNGGPIMPTISAHVRLMPAGFTTRDRRATDGTIFVVVEGEGEVIVEGKAIPLKPREILVVPSWKTLRFSAQSQVVLFGYSDKACQEKLNLYKEENL
jgi:gentisate 1,2-dioxygenase